MLKKIPYTSKEEEIETRDEYYVLCYSFRWGKNKCMQASYTHPVETLDEALAVYLKMRDMTDWDGTPAYDSDVFKVSVGHRCSTTTYITNEALEEYYQRATGKIRPLTDAEIMQQMDEAIEANKDKYDKMADAYVEYEKQKEKDAQAADEYYADLTRRGYQFVMAVNFLLFYA